MSVATQKQMLSHVVRKTVFEYVRLNQMFTVYQIWKDASFISKTTLDYDLVRNVVESMINDNLSNIPGWCRTVGSNFKLDNTVGKVGSAPQIYHPVQMSISNYDPNFTLNNSVKITHPVKTEKNVSGLFKFNVWFHGKLVPCNLRNPRGNGGKFIKNKPYEGHGVLDSGVPVLIKQDQDGKLYALSLN